MRSRGEQCKQIRLALERHPLYTSPRRKSSPSLRPRPRPRPSNQKQTSLPYYCHSYCTVSGRARISGPRLDFRLCWSFVGGIQGPWGCCPSKPREQKNSIMLHPAMIHRAGQISQIIMDGSMRIRAPQGRSTQVSLSS